LPRPRPGGAGTGLALGLRGPPPPAPPRGAGAGRHRRLPRADPPRPERPAGRYGQPRRRPAPGDGHHRVLRPQGVPAGGGRRVPLHAQHQLLGVLMAERTVSIGSKVGLHARPASLFVKAAGEAGIPVKIAKEGGNPVDAASILAVMTLGAKNQDTVILTTEGERADDVLDSLAELLATDLDEK